MTSRLTVVLDVGKTMAKASLWAPSGDCIRRETRINQKVDAGCYPALDAAGIEAWLGEALADFAHFGPVGSIIPVAHGAAAAIIRDGRLALPPMDYECEPPEDIREAYLRDRDPFSVNGSPPMGLELNLGLQLQHLERLFPDLLSGDATIVPWAQYWAWRLSGVAACEVSSLGSHTDLWDFRRNRPSPLAKRRGWAARLAGLRPAAEALGVLLPEWVARTGLPADVKVHTGLHDSNAALNAARAYPQIAGRDATVVSTGTWFVSMRSPGADADLEPMYLASDPGRLINIDPAGAPVPTALFMGGREVEGLSEGVASRIDADADQDQILAAVPACLASGTMVLPTLAPGTGPFPDLEGGWVGRPTESSQIAAAIGLYAALVVDHALDRIGARDTLLIEGRFANAATFVRGLAALRADTRTYVSPAGSDVSFGTLQILHPSLKPGDRLVEPPPLGCDLTAYRDLWRDRLARTL